jgi:hypothetical protein
MPNVEHPFYKNLGDGKFYEPKTGNIVNARSEILFVYEPDKSAEEVSQFLKDRATKPKIPRGYIPGKQYKDKFES